MNNLTKGILFCIVSITIYLLNILCLQLNWLWFFVPLGLMPITFWHSAGLLGIFIFIKMLGKDADMITAAKGDDESIIRNLTFGLSFSLFGILFGYIYHSLL